MINTENLTRTFGNLTAVNSLNLQIEKGEVFGNLEKKLYRSTATYFAPPQIFNFTPKNPNLIEAYEIYNNIQKKMINQTANYGDIPQNTDPIDYAFYINMTIFAEVCSQPDIQKQIINLKQKLSKCTYPTRVV